MKKVTRLVSAALILTALATSGLRASPILTSDVRASIVGGSFEHIPSFNVTNQQNSGIAAGYSATLNEARAKDYVSPSGTDQMTIGASLDVTSNVTPDLITASGQLFAYTMPRFSNGVPPGATHAVGESVFILDIKFDITEATAYSINLMSSLSDSYLSFYRDNGDTEVSEQGPMDKIYEGILGVGSYRLAFTARAQSTWPDEFQEEGNFNLKATFSSAPVASVDDTAATALMLGLAGAGLVALRRKLT